MQNVNRLTQALVAGLGLATCLAFVGAAMNIAGFTSVALHALTFAFAAPVLLATVVATAGTAERQQFVRGRLPLICLGVGTLSALAAILTPLLVVSGWLRLSFVLVAAAGVMLIVLLARLERGATRTGARGGFAAPGYREQAVDFEQDATGQLLFLAGTAFLILGALLAAHDGRPIAATVSAGSAGLAAGWLGSWAFGLLNTMIGRITGIAIRRPVVARFGAVGWISGVAGFMATGSYYYLYLLVPSAVAMLWPVARSTLTARARPKLVVVGSTRQTLSRPQLMAIILCQLAAISGLVGMFVTGVGFTADIVWPAMTAAALWLQILAVSRKHPVQHWRAVLGIALWLLAPWLWLWQGRMALVALGLGSLLILLSIVPGLFQDRRRRGLIVASVGSNGN